jgi:hypothetical protein
MSDSSRRLSGFGYGNYTGSVKSSRYTQRAEQQARQLSSATPLEAAPPLIRKPLAAEHVAAQGQPGRSE